jgi:DNA-binding HxlR family transcriptional regulator
LSPNSKSEGGTSPDDLKVLGGFFLQDPLKNSVRVLILLSLGMNQHLGFTDLLELTRVSKGSLSHHLDALREAGLVRTRTVFTLAGPRVRAEITPQGRAVFEGLTRTLVQVSSRENSGPRGEGSTSELSSR